jgi:hypothetical protein
MISLPGRDSRACLIRGSPTRTVPGPSQRPRPTPREEKHLKPPFKQTKEPEHSRESDEESSLEEEPPPDITEQSDFSEEESSEEELPVSPEHYLEIKEFHY